MAELHNLTILVGPPTPMSLRLNQIVREERRALAASGLNAVPSRLATPALKKIAAPDSDPVQRGRDFAEAIGGGSAFLSAVGFLTLPKGAVTGSDIVPDATDLFARLGGPLSLHRSRIVVAVDSFPALCHAARSEAVDNGVRRTEWEQLYELEWLSLFAGIEKACPDAEIAILTPKGAAVRSPEVLSYLFGPAMEGLSDPYRLLDLSLDDTGRAVLRRMRAEENVRESTVADLYDSFAPRPAAEDVAERLGIDRLTGVLLEQRLEEDLATLSAHERMVVL